MTFLMQYLRLFLVLAVLAGIFVVLLVVAAFLVGGAEWVWRRLRAHLGRAGGGR